jgi:hypothetical protein
MELAVTIRSTHQRIPRAELSMRSRSHLLCVAAALCAGANGSAQGAGAGEGRPFHVLVLTTGMSTMSVDALNARMAASQFAPLSNDAVSYGASGYMAVGRALLGGEISRCAFGEEGLNSGRTDELSAIHGMATASYAIVSTERLTVFPQLGVGAGRLDVTLRDRASAGTISPQPTFDEVAQSPGPDSRISGRHLLYAFGGGADYLVSGAGSSKGVVLGIRAGMLMAPNRTTWTREGKTVVAGPDAAAGGPYLRVAIGLGGR